MLSAWPSLEKITKNGRHLIKRFTKHPVLASSLVVTGFVLGIRYLGGWQFLELSAYDQMIRMRPEVRADQRLLIVEITEEDIRAQNQWPLADATIAQLLQKLQRYKPQVIGLDLFRDIPIAQGQAQLLQQLKAPNIVTVMKLGEGDDTGIQPPPGVPPEKVGFSDVLIDADGVIRRNLLYAYVNEPNNKETYYSFALQLSRLYLATNNQQMQVRPDGLRIGQGWFPSITSNAGGYVGVDDNGYQVLLNYRSLATPAQTVTLTQVLNGKFNPDWVRDRIVMIGTTAPSAKDLFKTPYNLSAKNRPATPGVVIHAQMTSQILSTALDRRAPIWYWSDWVEGLWVISWSLVGGLLAFRLRQPLVLSAGIVLAIAMLTGLSYGLFLQAGWVPLVPAAIALVGTGFGVILYRQLHDAFHDELTDLPNRTRFTQQLRSAISHRSRAIDSSEAADAPLIAALFLGLDNFKTINDSFGHRLGDQLLVATTKRLQACLHPKDQLARIGGDEFAILRQCVIDPDEVTHLADRLQQQMSQPFKLATQEVFTTASVGIVLDRADSGCVPEEILRDAHTAMNRAKASGKARHEVFVTGMRLQVMSRMQLETDLRRAVSDQQFKLHYQPVIALQTGEIAGFEALVRWQHPERGFVPPIEFIPIAEETNLIIPLGQWIIGEACRQLKIWQDKFPKDPPLVVSVNLSGKQFAQSDLVEQIKNYLEENKLDGRSLKLEITESIAMTDVEATIALLQQLKALNLKLSIDDFGTGYSSLSYLHRFPTNTIKVDRSFVSRMGYESESEDTHIVQTIIMLGHNLGMDIVAEGVETKEQLERLRGLGCEYGQGYFFSKPQSPEAIEKLLVTNPKW